MNNFRKFDQLRTTELQVIRKGFFNPTYILTDGQFDYAQLSCLGAFKREKIIETAEGNYRVKQIGWLGKETQIIDEAKGQVIGAVKRNSWDTKVALEMTNGFNAILKRGPGFFSRELNWTNDQYGDAIKIKSCYKWHTSFKITYDSNIIKTTFPLALITLIGVNIIMVRQAQAAAM
jgi:hypothetical protein